MSRRREGVAGWFGVSALSAWYLYRAFLHSPSSKRLLTGSERPPSQRKAQWQRVFRDIAGHETSMFPPAVDGMWTLSLPGASHRCISFHSVKSPITPGRPAPPMVPGSIFISPLVALSFLRTTRRREGMSPFSRLLFFGCRFFRTPIFR